MSRMRRCLAALATTALLAAPAVAQYSGITLPPDGANEKAEVTQYIGLVKVTIGYNSPHVHTLAGEDRRGKIFGKGALVQYGMTDLGFGSCKECPWRGGANENTTFTTSHDIEVQGQRLAAGTYGLHFIPDANEWTIIFSRTSTAWGSFFYDAKDDALRVKAKPATSEYHEDLTYEFRDRKSDSATAVLRWEDLQLPFSLKVENINDLYYDKIRQQLQSTGGFYWLGWTTAAQYLLTTHTHLPEALVWAQHGVDPNYTGQENLATLFTLSMALDANGKKDEGKAMLVKAIHSPATTTEIHLVGRQLLTMKRYDDAMEVFSTNAKLHPTEWLPHFGLARGHLALGQKEQALAEAKIALQKKPDATSEKTVKDFIASLEANKTK
jgi:hypothetical protein